MNQQKEALLRWADPLESLRLALDLVQCHTWHPKDGNIFDMCMSVWVCVFLFVHTFSKQDQSFNLNQNNWRFTLNKQKRANIFSGPISVYKGLIPMSIKHSAWNYLNQSGLKCTFQSLSSKYKNVCFYMLTLSKPNCPLYCLLSECLTVEWWPLINEGESEWEGSERSIDRLGVSSLK